LLRGLENSTPLPDFISHEESLCYDDVQVNKIQADNNTLATSKEALDLYEDVSTAIRLKPSGLEQSLIDQVVDIFQTHPVRLVDLQSPR
jgi:hypothetical protein